MNILNQIRRFASSAAQALMARPGQSGHLDTLVVGATHFASGNEREFHISALDVAPQTPAVVSLVIEDTLNAHVLTLTRRTADPRAKFLANVEPTPAFEVSVVLGSFSGATGWDRAQARFREVQCDLGLAMVGPVSQAPWGAAQGVPSRSPSKRGRVKPFLLGALTSAVLVVGGSFVVAGSAVTAQVRVGSAAPATDVQPGATPASKLGAPDQAALDDATEKLMQALSPAQRTAMEQVALGKPANQALAELNAGQANPGGGDARPLSSEARFSASEMAWIREHATVLGAGDADAKKVIYAFEDPMCTACRHFAQQSKSLPKGYAVKVIPVAFQPGAMNLAVGALCSKKVDSSWADAMRGSSLPQASCAKGQETIEANNRYFLTTLNMNLTPILVTPNGAVVKGSADTQVIAEWMDMNQL